HQPVDPHTATVAAHADAAERITPIAAHPRFAPDPAVAVDPQVVAGLRTLGGGPGFLREVIESFCADAGQIMRRLADAAAAADAAGVARSRCRVGRPAR